MTSYKSILITQQLGSSSSSQRSLSHITTKHEHGILCFFFMITTLSTCLRPTQINQLITDMQMAQSPQQRPTLSRPNVNHIPNIAVMTICPHLFRHQRILIYFSSAITDKSALSSSACSSTGSEDIFFCRYNHQPSLLRQPSSPPVQVKGERP